MKKKKIIVLLQEEIKELQCENEKLFNSNTLLKSLIKDCKIELEERDKIIEKQKHIIDNKDLLFEITDKRLLELVYKSIADEETIKQLKIEITNLK